MKKVTLIAVAAIGLVGASSAGVIWDATTANTTLFNNGANGSVMPTLTGATPNLLLTNVNGVNNSGGFTSSQNIQTLNGGVALTAADTVVMKMTIDSVTGGALRSNGIEMGIAASTGFRADSSNLISALKPQHGFSDAVIQVTSFQDVGNMGFDVVESSLMDGVSYTLTANEAGYTFLFEDIIVSSATGIYNDGDTTASFSGTFAGNEFLTYFNSGYFYTTTQKYNTDIVVDYSEASITVIPEPATLGLVGVFGGGILFIRRRFMI